MADQLRAAAEQALEALDKLYLPGELERVNAAITALRAALAQQAEPVQSAARVDAYDMIDRFLRNNLRDDDYAEYSAALDSLYTAPPQQAEPVAAVAESCTWHQDGDSESSVYATSCHNYFHLTDGTPADNDMRWCCYCGKKLVQELIEEDGNG